MRETGMVVRAGRSVDGIRRGGHIPRMETRLPECRTHLRSTVYARGKIKHVVSMAGDDGLHHPSVMPRGPRRAARGCLDGIVGIRSYQPDPSVSAPLAPPDVFLDELTKHFGRSIRAGWFPVRIGITLPDFGAVNSWATMIGRKTAYAPFVGAVALGMASAIFVEHSFGGSVSAGERRPTAAENSVNASLAALPDIATFGEEEVIAELGALTAEDVDRERLESRIRELVKGYPIEEMIPYIMKEDRVAAIFLVAIAKKESDWGRRVPVLDGQDCFNYWGYRGQRKLMGTGGHTCFNSRKDAVETVGERLRKLIYDNKLDTPSELILWKCGSTCAGHSSYSVRKWISDVDLYFGKLNEG